METGPRPRDFYEQAQRESVDRQDVALLALDLLTRAGITTVGYGPRRPAGTP